MELTCRVRDTVTYDQNIDTQVLTGQRDKCGLNALMGLKDVQTVTKCLGKLNLITRAV